MDDPVAIGARLREARMRQGLGITECAEATRIRERYLVAIEDGRFESLPDPAYVSGFVRAYATHLGVSASEPERELPVPGGAPHRSGARPVRVDATRITARGVGARPPLWRRLVVVLIVVASGAAVAILLGALPAPSL
ncbi:helix-turn-helix domain-containing protein [Miltoncostaea marina]|uniref:helix-turn-helix domain-containing protein n=1 Tax=Miltoncostaea marina TaxID=2843215 RepID=UPI001C3C500C|nr:helix-turn-helix transcriptional regulator [Miltoncostaea marina]